MSDQVSSGLSVRDVQVLDRHRRASDLALLLLEGTPEDLRLTGYQDSVANKRYRKLPAVKPLTAAQRARLAALVLLDARRP